MNNRVKEKDIELMQNLLKLKEKSLFNSLHDILVTNYKYPKVIRNKQFLYAPGDIPVALVAHVDTVYKEPPSIIFHDQDYSVLWSPQGLGADDRAGVFAILKILSSGLRPTVIFTRGEEKGGIGAYALINKFPSPVSQINFIIELDRANFEDAVYYDCDNTKFETYINSFGFTTKEGTFSDISIIAPIWEIAAVNLSIGYVNEHSYIEHWFYDSCFDTIKKVSCILEDVQNATEGSVSFKYVPKVTRRIYGNNESIN